MSKQQTITQEKFDELLAWLDPDRAKAGNRYEEIRRSLIKIFTWRGCSDAEGMADETINRVAQKAQEFRAGYVGDPAAYFYGVANRLTKEYQRYAKTQVSLDDAKSPVTFPVEEPEEDLEREYECLHKCLRQLTPETREMVLSYYLKDKQAKIHHRKDLARQLGIEANTLRVKMYRIRAALEECIENCLEQSAADAMD